MKMYTVYDIKNGIAGGINLRLQDRKKSELTLPVPKYFVEGMKVGDKVRSLGIIENIPVALVYNKRLILTSKPESDRAMMNFVTNYMGTGDLIYLQNILVRSLLAHGITPTFKVSENLVLLYRTLYPTFCKGKIR